MNVTEVQEADSSALEAQRGKRVLRRWLFGFFGTMFIANGFFLWFALSTHTGEQSSNAYEEGRSYNDTLAEAARLDALGWQMDAGVVGDSLQINLKDFGAQPITTEVLSVRLFSHRDASADRELAFHVAGSGLYVADVTGVDSGRWELRLRLTSPDGPVELRREILVN